MTKDADRKLARAVVLLSWAGALCIMVATVAGTSDAARPQAVAMVAETKPADEDVIRQAALAIEQESTCLAQAIYHEARSESDAGQLAVAEVVINRVLSGRYADTICGVVFQGSERRTGCQFSFTCDGSLDKKIDAVAWDRAERLARNVVLGHRRNIVGDATHYHADYVDPYWASSLDREKKIGRHIFYSDETGPTRG